MHLESHESADDRQYYDYHMDRNGHSLHGDEQDLTPTKMKEPTAREYIESGYGTQTFARTVAVKDAESLLDLMDDFAESHTQAHTEGLREQLMILDKDFCHLSAENSDLSSQIEGVRYNNKILRERVKELEVKQSKLTSAMHEALSQLVQGDYVKANFLIYSTLKNTDEL